MQQIRKPRVFLSHSKKDVQFIRRLHADLLSCQCEPWIDEIEIRHGQPWLDEIFAAGIPSCEVLLCYVIEHSIDSDMVKQEIDARLLERLRNNRVALLMYLAAEELRPRLRLDLQRLQAPVLNETNYNTVLPRMIAEIWRSYAELSAFNASQSERVQRLEAELRIKDLESNAAQSIFAPRESADFAVIWSKLDREVDIAVEVVKKIPRTVGGLQEMGQETELDESSATNVTFVLHAGALFRSAVATQKYQPSARVIEAAVQQDVYLHLNLEAKEYAVKLQLPLDYEAELLRYGMVERQPVPPEPTENRILASFRPRFRVVFTPKFDRFSFWLEHSFGEWEKLTTVLRRKIDA